METILLNVGIFIAGTIVTAIGVTGQNVWLISCGVAIIIGATREVLINCEKDLKHE